MICHYRYFKDIGCKCEPYACNGWNKSKECMICHYWCFKDIGYKCEPNVCNGCHDTLMMANELENTAILNVKGIDYRYILWNMTKIDVVNRLNNSKIDNKRTLWIWILVQIKHLLK